MDVRTLRTFHCVVEQGSFMRAAEEMNYAQSTVTMQIQKLEKELGVPLLERGKGVQLTEAGRLLREQSREIVQRMEQLQAQMADLQNGKAGSVRIGMTDPTASYRMPSVLKRFMNENPGIRVAVAIAGTPALIGQLHDGEIDFAVCSAPDIGTELYFQPLFDEEFVVLMPQGHPLAEQAAVKPGDLQAHRLLITSPTCPYRKKLEMVLQETGSTSLDTMEIGSMTSLHHYVAAGMGVALVPGILLNPLPPGTVCRPVDGARIHMPTGLLSKPFDHTLPSAAARLYRYVEQELQSR